MLGIDGEYEINILKINIASFTVVEKPKINTMASTLRLTSVALNISV